MCTLCPRAILLLQGPSCGLSASTEEEAGVPDNKAELALDLIIMYCTTICYFIWCDVASHSRITSHCMT